MFFPGKGVGTRHNLGSRASFTRHQRGWFLHVCLPASTTENPEFPLLINYPYCGFSQSSTKTPTVRLLPELIFSLINMNNCFFPSFLLQKRQVHSNLLETVRQFQNLATGCTLLRSILLQPNTTDWVVYNEQQCIGSRFRRLGNAISGCSFPARTLLLHKHVAKTRGQEEALL